MITQHNLLTLENDNVDLSDYIEFNVEGLAEVKLGAIEELVSDEYVDRCLKDTKTHSFIEGLAVTEGVSLSMRRDGDAFPDSEHAVDRWVRYLQLSISP